MFPRIFFIFFLVLSPSFGNESEGPSETECRPYIEKALQREGVTQEPTLPPDDVGEPPNLSEAVDGSKEDAVSKEEATSSNEDALESAEDASVEAGVPLQEASVDDNSAEELFQESSEAKSEETLEGSGEASAPESTEEIEGDVENSNEEVAAAETIESLEPASNEVSAEEAAPSSEETAETTSAEALESQETTVSEETGTEVISETETSEDKPASDVSVEQIVEENTENSEQDVKPEQPQPQSEEDGSGETQTVEILSSEEVVASESTNTGAAPAEAVGDEASEPSSEEPISQESASEEQAQVISDSPVAEESIETAPDDSGSNDSVEQPDEKPSLSADASSEPQVEPAENEASPVAEAVVEAEEAVIPEEEVVEKNSEESLPEGSSPVSDEQPTSSEGEDAPVLPEEDLIMPIEIPSNLRTREHMTQILKLGQDADDKEKLLAKTMDNTLRELKKLYDVAIKPLEILYKYRDLSNRHFGDPEIFSKPLVLFMGPWSGGKSTIINYLLENEFKKTALRSGAEPSPAYFNIVMHGENEEILDGTQLAADWTFSGLQKFGQGLLDRLRGLRLNHPLLQKVNIVEIPGILEIRKQVERLFPFNDACQWFIDRADIIFLVYDPSKLDVGPETEAILDQLKGREMQTRIVLNKADQVKPEELMRVQSTLIWNISPLMSSTEPPVMYSTSLWSLPYEVGAPSRLLYAQECSFLQDLREAIDKRVENKIASARRFAVRVRNHAKMVDCYLTTYYNHKSFFGNKKKVSDDIIEHPQDYHIYEGLSTLTNISRYDLPDPDVYKDFFRLNPVYEFQQLAATCTYFRGCPINRLDVAIAYDLPDLIGKYKKSAEQLLSSRK